MNYYERHIGDYLKGTAHLSLLEHGVYTRLLDVYYTRESGIPEAEAPRLIGAKSRAEKTALHVVLGDFFVLRDGIFFQERAEREIGRYVDSQVGAGDRRENDKERQRRARDRRKSLFSQLREHKIVPAFDTNTGQLESLVSRVTTSDSSEIVTPHVTRDDTATHTHTHTHTPEEEKEPHTRTNAGRVCLALRRTGIGGVNPGHPDLLALIAAGATEAEFVGAAQTAVERIKGFAYALGMLKRQRTDAAKTSASMHTGPMPTAPPTRQSATDRQIATMNALTGKDRDHDRKRAPADIIDIAARVVP